MISPELLAIMACPLCKSPLEHKEQKLLCTHGECGCRYPVQDDIPIMLIDEAERPCPACGQQRMWDPEKDTLRCEKCGKSYVYVPPGAPAVGDAAQKA